MATLSTAAATSGHRSSWRRRPRKTEASGRETKIPHAPVGSRSLRAGEEERVRARRSRRLLAPRAGAPSCLLPASRGRLRLGEPWGAKVRNALREGGRTDGRQNRYGDIDTAMSDHGGKRQDTHSVARPPAGSPKLEREAVRPGRRKQANPGGKRPRCEERGLRGFAGVLAENYVCRDDTWSQKLPATGCASRPIRGGAGGADARVAPGGAASGFPSQLCFQKTASSLRRAAAEAWTPSQTGSKSRAEQPSAVWPGFYRLPGESGLQPEFRATAGERAPSCDGRRHRLVPRTAPQS